jgi:hypothetical protein
MTDDVVGATATVWNMTSGEQPLTCQACGALVAPAQAQRHQDFHDDTPSKKAMEEAERRAALNLRSQQ